VLRLCVASCLLCVTLIVVSSIFTFLACSSACRKIDAPLIVAPFAFCFLRERRNSGKCAKPDSGKSG